MKWNIKWIQEKLRNLRVIHEAGNNEQLCYMAYSTNSLVDPEPVVKVAKPSNVKPKNPLTEEDKQYIKDNNRSKSVLQIARHIKKYEATVHLYMKNNGIERFKRRDLHISGRMPSIIQSNNFFNVDAYMGGDKSWMI